MNILIALIAFATLAAFLVILAVFVPSIDLIAVIAFTLALVVVDFVTSFLPSKK